VFVFAWAVCQIGQPCSVHIDDPDVIVAAPIALEGYAPSIG
jgi:hypothetical protein